MPEEWCDAVDTRAFCSSLVPRITATADSLIPSVAIPGPRQSAIKATHRSCTERRRVAPIGEGELHKSAMQAELEATATSESTAVAEEECASSTCCGRTSVNFASIQEMHLYRKIFPSSRILGILKCGIVHLRLLLLRQLRGAHRKCCNSADPQRGCQSWANSSLERNTCSCHCCTTVVYPCEWKLSKKGGMSCPSAISTSGRQY